MEVTYTFLWKAIRAQIDMRSEAVKIFLRIKGDMAGYTCLQTHRREKVSGACYNYIMTGGLNLYLWV